MSTPTSKLPTPKGSRSRHLGKKRIDLPNAHGFQPAVSHNSLWELGVNSSELTGLRVTSSQRIEHDAELWSGRLSDFLEHQKLLTIRRHIVVGVQPPASR
jgi:hypothetical protein